jgi:hypothetical protein
MNQSDNELRDAPAPAGRLLDARLHLLDRQLLDEAGEPVGIIDDLDVDGVTVGTEIVPAAPAPRISSILTGQVLATRIFGGQPPPTKLQPLPWTIVASVGAVVRLHRTDQPFDGLWVERWLRDHIIAHIPGGRRAAK